MVVFFVVVVWFVVVWWWCFCGSVVVVVVRWCFCVGVVVFLWWWCGGVFFLVVVWWWCFCGGVVVVFLRWWCGGVFVVVCWCFWILTDPHIFSSLFITLLPYLIPTRPHKSSSLLLTFFLLWARLVIVAGPALYPFLSSTTFIYYFVDPSQIFTDPHSFSLFLTFYLPHYCPTQSLQGLINPLLFSSLSFFLLWARLVIVAGPAPLLAFDLLPPLYII